MDNYLIKKTTQDFIKTLVILIPAFLIFLSFIDLFVYYSFFEINIFSFITINSIISYSLQSIGIVTLISLLSYLVFFMLHFFFYLHDSLVKWISNKYPAESTRKLIFFSIIIAYLTVFYGIPVGLYYFLRAPISDFLIKHNLPEELFLISCLTVISVNVLFLIFEVNIKPTVPENKFVTLPYLYDLRAIVSIIIVSTIILTISKAYLDATNFLNNTHYQYIISDNLKGNYSNEKFKVIGTTGNYYFLEYPDKKGVLVKQFNDFKEVHIRTFRDTTITTD